MVSAGAERREMKIYLSGPITGIENYKDNFNKIASAVRLVGDRVINPAYLDMVLPADSFHEEFMYICYGLIELSDAVLLIPGWEDSKGANWEKDYAISRNIQVYSWEEYEEMCEWEVEYNEHYGDGNDRESTGQAG